MKLPDDDKTIYADPVQLLPDFLKADLAALRKAFSPKRFASHAKEKPCARLWCGGGRGWGESAGPPGCFRGGRFGAQMGVFGEEGGASEEFQRPPPGSGVLLDQGELFRVVSFDLNVPVFVDVAINKGS